MPSISGVELMVILAVALIVLGPERLPGAARSIGRVVGQIRDLGSNFQREMQRAIDIPDEVLKPVTRPLLTALEGGLNLDRILDDVPSRLPDGLAAEPPNTPEETPPGARSSEPPYMLQEAPPDPLGEVVSDSTTPRASAERGADPADPSEDSADPEDSATEGSVAVDESPDRRA